MTAISVDKDSTIRIFRNNKQIFKKIGFVQYFLILDVGITNFTIVSESQDKSSSVIYNYVFVRPAKSPNANLQKLNITDGKWTIAPAPDFQPNKLGNYSVSYEFGTLNFTLDIALSSPFATHKVVLDAYGEILSNANIPCTLQNTTISINSEIGTIYHYLCPILRGDTSTYHIIVTAENNINQKVYTILVHRTPCNLFIYLFIYFY